MTHQMSPGLYKKPPFSISRRLLFSLTLTVIVVSSLVIAYNYIEASRKATEELEIHSQEYLSQLTQILMIPLWNFDANTVESISAAYGLQEGVAGLKVVDSNGNVFADINKA
ncbi:MAG: hypothetical protein GY869_08470, partial [Planctomycetes bacterium]|nr:hypothetical protein [Planctomycetota bacterium]